MGAGIRVFGQEHIEITGSDGLDGTTYRVMADNMEAITWLAASVISGGDIEFEAFPYDDLEVVLAHLRAAGAALPGRGGADRARWHLLSDRDQHRPASRHQLGRAADPRGLGGAGTGRVGALWTCDFPAAVPTPETWPGWGCATRSAGTCW